MTPCHEYRCKIQNEILTNSIQYYIASMVHHDEMGFIPGMEGRLNIKNQYDSLY